MSQRHVKHLERCDMTVANWSTDTYGSGEMIYAIFQETFQKKLSKGRRQCDNAIRSKTSE